MNELPEVSTHEAVELAKSGVYLIDVREQDEWDAGHAAGAHLLPMSTFMEHIADVPSDQQVLVICQAGGRSARVTKALIDSGYDAVNVAGGTGAWAAAGGDIVIDPA
jgi:rhodanese-related sulfurtransferase